ncbi:MAG: prepilin-type N-terminal cleavage/methylation domain-containing protein, partial [Candidatus Omnitrophota bacterium]
KDLDTDYTDFCPNHRNLHFNRSNRSSKGFTLIEMLTTTAILVIVFGLLAIIFGRATAIHKIVRSGGDAENFGIYLINTITYGPGINRGKGLVGARPFNSNLVTTATDATCSDTLTFQGSDGQYVRYILDGSSVKYWNGGTDYVDLKPTWATDRQLEVIRLDASGNRLSEFLYYDTGLNPIFSTGVPVGYVGIKLMLKNTLQNIQEAVTLYRCVRVRNQIDF